jgi:hypothetical protein
MDQRDQELLDKQLKVISRSPLNSVSVGLVFLAGIAIGGILFPHERQQMQIASNNAVASISHLNGVPPNMR